MHNIPLKYILPLLGLTVSAFVFNTSEFMPIGLLLDMANSFNMTAGQLGIIITVYAWVVALLSLPLMLLASSMNVRKLLLLTVALFAIGQIASGLAVNFFMLVAARICVACAHAVFWSLAGPLATRLVTRVHRPFALSMIVTGSAIAMIFGLPIGRVIGLYAGWRMTFLIIAGIAIAIVIYQWRFFPELIEARTPEKISLKEMLCQPIIYANYLITILFATAYYTVYSYIEPFLQNVAHFDAEWITGVLMLLGVCGLMGSFIFSHFYGSARYLIIRNSLLGLFIPLMLWQVAASNFITMTAACMFIGMIATLFNVTFQAELIRNVPSSAAPVAMSISSGSFNIGIGGGTFIGSTITGANLIASIGYAGAVIAGLALICTLFIYLPAARKQASTIR